MTEIASQSSRDRDIFVSYASADAAIADELVRILERSGVAGWIAPRDVTPGAHYAEEIIRGITGCKALVLVLSANSIASKHVGKEVERAASKGKPIIAIRMDATPLTPGLEYFLSESQWVELGAGGIKEAAAKVVAAIRNQAEAPASPVMHPSAAKMPTSKAGLPRWVVPLGLVGVLVVAVGGYIASRPFSKSKPVAASTSEPAAPTGAAGTPLAVPEKSIAVLPFVDMSEKKDQEYFSDGLSEELIDHLAHVPDLKVMARTSSFAFKGKNEDMRSIATKLGVANLREGSVRKAGNQLRITAQLIRASDGVHLWSETYDRKLDDIFKVQDEISTTVAKALNVALGGNGSAGEITSSAGTANIEAYNRFLQGKYFFDRGRPGDNAKAVKLFIDATKYDRRYAIAWSSLANTYAWQGYVGELPSIEAEGKGMAAVQEALKIDPNSAAAYHARGQVRREVSGDWESARADYEKAVTLDPMGGTGERAKGNLSELGVSRSAEFDSAIQHLRESLHNSPLNFSAMSDLGYVLQYAGRLEESAVAYQMLLDKNHDYSTAHAFYGITLLLSKKYEDALVEAKSESDEANRLWALTCIYWQMGRRKQSYDALASLVSGYAAKNMYLIAASHAYRGDGDAAMTWLERAYEQRRGSLQIVKYDPMFKQMRSDPRFINLLKRSGLGDYGTAADSRVATKASSS